MGKLDNQSPPKYKYSFLGKAIKWLLLLILLSVLVIVIGLFLTNSYLQSNKTKIVEDLPFLNKATIAFEETEISLYKNFPSASITIHQLKVKDSLFQKHHNHLLDLGTLSASFSLKELLKKKITVHSVHIDKGKFRLHTDKNGYNNLKALLPLPDTKEKRKELELILDGLAVHISDLEVHITDDTKETSIHGQVANVQTTLDIEEGAIKGVLDLAVNVHEMIFKKEKGSFIENSELSGIASLKWNDHLVTVEPFDLTINEEIFEFSGTIPTNGGIANLHLVNKHTRFDRVIPLLPKKIQEQLVPYKITHPFYTTTLIKTDFKPNTMPLVVVDFTLDKNDLVVFDIPLNQTSLTGKFINTLNEHSQGLVKTRGNIKISVSDLSTHYESFYATTDDLVISSTKGKGGKIDSDIIVKGPVKGISKWLKNDQFFFEEGEFELTASLNGSLKNIEDIIIQTNAELSLTEFSVFYQPANSAFSFEKMKLEKRVGDAFFSIVTDSTAHGPTINIDGGLTNLPTLLLSTYFKQVDSEMHITSSKLTWQNFLNLFGEHGYFKSQIPKTDSEKKHSMKETLKGVYNNFRPKLTIQIDTLQYLDQFELTNFKSGLHFKNVHELILENTEFDYEDGHILFSGGVDISHPKNTPFDFMLDAEKINLNKLLPKVNYFNAPLLKQMDHTSENVSIQVKHHGVIDDEKGLIPNTSKGSIAIQNRENKIGVIKVAYEAIDTIISGKSIPSTNTEISLQGDPVVFNDFFKTDKFIFKEGFFKVDFEHNGSLNDIQDLLERASINFSLLEGDIYYHPTGITFPLAGVDLVVRDNNTEFDFILHSDSLERVLKFSGNLENLSQLVLGNTGKSLRTHVDVYSSKVKWKEFQNLFIGSREEKTTIQSMKITICDLFNTFNPTIHINADTFVYNQNLIVEGATTGIYLVDSTTVYLEKTGFHFHKGSMLLNGDIDLGHSAETPFDINLHAKDFDVAGLLQSLEYLSLPTLKQAKKLRGNITMNLDLKGEVAADGKGLVTSATQGILNFDLHDLEIKGFQPLHAIGEKLRMKNRFDDIVFAPISSQIQINGNNMGFPLTEIQSNAVHLFMEGIFSFGMDTNLWLSIPLNNLRKRDLTVVPDKENYAVSKRKIHLESTSDETGAIKFKFFLTKRKFYKQRGLLDKYKAKKKEHRAVRKAARKERGQK